MIGPVSDKFLLPTTTQIWWIWFIYRVVIGGLESSDRDKFSIYKDLEFFCFSGTLFHKPDCVLIIQSCNSSPVVLERLQKVLLANVKAMAISEFESILTSCLRTHLKTHWGEHLQCNNLFLQFFFINHSIRVEVVEPKRFDFESDIT